MKIGIRVLLGLFFILSSFMLGKHFYTEDFDVKIKRYESIIFSLKSENYILKDSLAALKKKVDSLKVSGKQISSMKKVLRR